MMLTIPILFLASVLASPVTQSGLSAIPKYRKPSKQSIASYVQSINRHAAYEVIMQVKAEDSHVVHVSNLPSDFVECGEESITLSFKNQSMFSSWPKMSQLILVLEEKHKCPHITPIYVSTSWTENEDYSITFKTSLAVDAGVDAEINILVRPKNVENLLKNGWSEGYDGYYDYDGDDDFPTYDEIVNRTKVYPYKFDYNIMNIFDIGHTGAFLKCEPCHVKGELDLVMVAKGTILNNFQATSYIGGSMTGTFKVAAGLRSDTSSNRMRLFRYQLAEIELPGILYLNPSFTVYGVTQLESEQDINIDLGIMSEAKDFHVTLVSIGNHTDASATLDSIEGLITESLKTPSVKVETPFAGEVNFDAALSMRPELELGYKIMGYPKSSFIFAIDNGVVGDFIYNRPGDLCPNQIFGRLDARSSMIADIGIRKIIKESQSLKLMEGCF